MVIAITKLIPLLILCIGVILLLVKKKYNIIFFGIIGLLALESIPYLRNDTEKYESIWVLYFGGVLYFFLIHFLYKRLFFSLLNMTVFRFLAGMLCAFMIMGLVFIHKQNPSFIFHYMAIIEFIILLYPINYFLKLVKQTIPHEFQYFILNSIIFLFFSLDIILYIMMKHLVEFNMGSIIRIGVFRYYVIQLFYISLIYFGCKLQKQ